MLTEKKCADFYADTKPIKLPEEAEHGTLAAIRLGCSCDKCNAKRARLRRHGFYVR